MAGDGTGAQSPPAALPGVTVLAAAFLEHVDLEGDGTLDIIEADHDRSPGALVAVITGSGFTVCIASGDGAGSFEHTPVRDCDRKLDLVTADAGSHRVSVHLANF